MLTHTGDALPLAVYRQMYSYMDRHDLARLLRVCLRLFEITAPYVWRRVDLSVLLRILYGHCVTPSGGYGSTEQAMSAVVHHCFDRAQTYGTYVEHLEISSRYTKFGRSSTQSADLRGSIANALLPRLKTLSFSFDFIDLSNHEGLNTWIVLFVPNTVHELIFRAGRHHDAQLIGPLLSRFPALTRFKFSLPQLGQWDSWGSVYQVHAPSKLEELDFECLGLNSHALSWMSKMPCLHTLRLSFSSADRSSGSEDLSDPTGTKYSGSFQALKSLWLRLSGRRWHEAMQIWSSPIVANLTRVTIVSFGSIGSSAALTSQFFSALAAHSPRVYHLEIEEAGLDHDPQNLRLPMSFLSDLGPLPLRVFKIQRSLTQDDEHGILETIANLWPDLEDLSLPATVIELCELVNMTSFLPKLGQLQVCIPLGKSSPEPLRDILADYAPTQDSPVVEDFLRRPALIIGLGPPELSAMAAMFGESQPPIEKKKKSFGYKEQDEDFLAKTLVELSSNVEIMQSWQSILRPYFRERVSFYLEARGRKSSSKE